MAAIAGSTPRMRGIYTKEPDFVINIRFNPAYAGNILIRNDPELSTRVQPRVCGEYKEDDNGIDRITGSTPRMRGIYSDRAEDATKIRFNPAYAGNIPRKTSSSSQIQVQPRVCGEYEKKYHDGLVPVGSTPRMRGI